MKERRTVQCSDRLPALQAWIPAPIQIVIDDVGWRRGVDGHERGEPFRTGMGRNHGPADYEAVVSLGRQLGMRPQAAMALCEWDRDNILRDLPTATWLGSDWDNSACVGPWMDEAAAVIREGAAHFELTLHAVGHEYWETRRMTRAEWFDPQNRMRPREQVLRHLEAYMRLLDRNDLPLPESFVPAAFQYGFGDPQEGFACILREHGIRHISTPFAQMRRAREPEAAFFGVECGLVTVDRGTEAPFWSAKACRPDYEVDGPIVGLHWPNLLHPDPDRNEEVVARWVEFLRPYDARCDRMLAPDTRRCWTQLVYCAGAEVSRDGGGIILDFGSLCDLDAALLGDEFTLKIALPSGRTVASSELEVVRTLREPASGLLRATFRRRRGLRRARLDSVDASAGEGARP
jgi:hypothetical protein